MGSWLAKGFPVTVRQWAIILPVLDLLLPAELMLVLLSLPRG